MPFIRHPKDFYSGLIFVAFGIAVLVLFAASAFLPRWWSHRIGNQADGSFTNGIGLGLFYGFTFTLLALVLLVILTLVWGTNWPHPNSTPGNATGVNPLWPVDDGLVFNLLPTWAPDAAVRKKILVDNPARLYEF